MILIVFIERGCEVANKRFYFSTQMLIIIVVVAVVIFAAGLAWDRILLKATGFATSGTADVNITVGNNAPFVTFVSPVPATDPSENGVRNVTFTFVANDLDGVANLNDSTARAYVNFSSDPVRTNSSCSHVADLNGTSANYSCTINMWYFDGAGGWSIHANISDVNSATGTNHSPTFTYNQLTAMVMSPSTLTWATLTLTSENQSSNNDPVLINNTGNDPIASGSVRVNAIDLGGEVITDEYIYAGNFSVGTTSPGCGSTTLVNGTATGITGASLPRGNHSVNDGSTGQEQLYYCITALNSDISAQAYSTAAGGAWTVDIL